MVLYVSFSSPSKFLGGLYLSVDNKSDVTKRVKDLGIVFPKGEVEALVMDVPEHVKVRDGFFDRLLSMEEVDKSIVGAGH